MDTQRDVRIERLDNGDYRLQWSGAPVTEPATIYAGDRDHKIDRDRPVAEATGNEAVIAGLDPRLRHYFELVFPDSTGVLAAERRLAFEGTANFRDMGGYRGYQGRMIRWGRLFRSGKLSQLTESDVALFGELDIGIVCDFRRDDERAREPSALPAANPPEIAGLPIMPGSTDSFFGGVRTGRASADDMAAFMAVLNRDLALNQTDKYRAMFDSLLRLNGRQLLIHCAAGKDRTGFGAALILGALGVDRDTIMADYLLSNEYIPIDREVAAMRARYDEFFPADLDASVIRPMFEVRPDYLQAAFAAIDEAYGGLMQYLEQALRLNAGQIEQLRAEFLYR